jgi:hypothetical protein
MGICECGGIIRPPTKVRAHTVEAKVEAAVYNGSDVQDRAQESTTHDSCNGTGFYLLRVTNFFRLLWMQPCTEPSSSEGGMQASKAFKLQAYHKTLWAY